MNLRTSRLFLRPLEVSDAPALFEARRDPDVMRYWDWPAQNSVGEVEGIIADHIPQVADGNVLWWAVALSPDGPAIGECDLSQIDRRNGVAEVGFLFARRHWGNGYAHEATETVIAQAFGPMGLARLWARFHAGNEASRACSKSLDLFTKERCASMSSATVSAGIASFTAGLRAIVKILFDCSSKSSQTSRARFSLLQELARKMLPSAR